MSTSAIVMMVVAMLVVWGGLALAIVLLIRSDRSTARTEADPHGGPRNEHLTRDL